MESYKNVQYLSCLTDTLVRSDQISSQNIMSLIILQMAWALRTNMFPLSLPQSPPTKGASARMELAAWKMTHDVERDSAWLFWWLHSAKRTKMCLFPHNEPLSLSDTQGAALEGGEADAFRAAWPLCWGDVCCLCSVRMLRNSLRVPLEACSYDCLHCPVLLDSQRPFKKILWLNSSLAINADFYKQDLKGIALVELL